MDQIKGVNAEFNPILTDQIANPGRELDHIEEALNALSVSLTSDQQRAEEMQADTNRIRANVPPIRKLHPDVLSLVFIACSQREWNAPQTIGAVCRLWRNVLLSTPRAWAYIHLDGLNRTQKELWMARSCEVSIHALSKSRIPASVEGIGIRSTKLGTLSLRCGEKRWSTILLEYFPRLTVLKLENREAWDGSWLLAGESSKNTLAWSNFPSLRELRLTKPSALGASLFVGEGLAPPLEELAFAKPEGNAWIQVLENVAKSLISLELWLGSQNSVGEDKGPSLVRLPQLIHLTLIIQGSSSSNIFSFPVNLSTPRLHSYHEKSLWTSSWETSPVHQDVSSVSKASIITYSSHIDLSKFRSLEQLTIDGYDLRCWADALCRIAPHEYPHLQRIRVIDRFGTIPLEAMREAQEHYRRSGRYWDLVTEELFNIKYHDREWVRGEPRPFLKR